jgi:2-polyprenyl-6-hydroxyphenyl methylase/3-demethylubiquinone-9 3-methyltransferase
MLRPACNESWPESWKLSNTYDEIEVWGGHSDLGYSYQYRNRREWALHAIGELVPSGAGILDVAAASGNFTLALAEMGYCVIWNDLRGELAELVRLKYEFGQVEFAPGNIFDLAGAWAACFDAVVAFEVIEHMAHPDQFLACIAAMVKPGGRIFLTTPNGRYFRFHLPRFSECPDPSIYEAVQFKPNSDGHIFLLDAAEFRTMAANVGLEIERLDLITNPLTHGHIKLGRLLPYLPASLVSFFELGTRKLPRPLRERLHCQMVAVLRRPVA